MKTIVLGVLLMISGSANVFQYQQLVEARRAADCAELLQAGMYRSACRYIEKLARFVREIYPDFNDKLQ